MTLLAKIKTPGLQSTIQDAGRIGFRHFGVPQSGAADRLSFAFANLVVGNPWDAATIECTLVGPALQFETATIIAIAGTDMAPRLNKTPVAAYSPIDVLPGDELVLGAARKGARCYIAFAGGLAGIDFLGSASTYLPGEIGGVDGRALRENDRVFCAGVRRDGGMEIPEATRPRFAHDWILRVTEGPEFLELENDAADLFFAKPFRAGQRGNRMGMQLVGPPLECRSRPPMKSSAVYPGTIQCPPDGSPFLLMPDAQTIGGYPRIAQVIDADIHLTGQIAPGDRVWFRKVDTEEAGVILRQKLEMLAVIDPKLFY